MVEGRATGPGRGGDGRGASGDGSASDGGASAAGGDGACGVGTPPATGAARPEPASPEPAPTEPSTAHDSRVASLAQRLEARFGPGIDPGISLEPAGAPVDASRFGSEALRRLAERPDASGRYTFEADVDSGGQGAVVKVYDKDLHRHLAMKLTLGTLSGSSASPATPGRTGEGPAPGGAQQADPAPNRPGAPPAPPLDPRTVGRFLEEAQVTGQLDHPGVVPVHELGLDPDGRVFFTMKLVKGEDLKAVFARVHRGEPGWSVTRVLGLLLRACEALSYAHAKRVIHRDLKPANIMVGKFGEVYVMDWGLARVLDRPDGKDLRLRSDDAPPTISLRGVRHEQAADHSDPPLVTMDGDIVGTPVYMPPEQARGDLQRLGPASDVYALGAMLYHLLSGRIPYTVPGAYVGARQILTQVQAGPPKPLHELAPDAPAELVAICERAMARQPEQRYADMTALADDLRAYLEHRVVSAYETGAVAELRKWVVRNKPLAAALAGVLLLVIGAGGGFAWLTAQLSTRNVELSATNAALDGARSSLQERNDALDAALSDAQEQRARADTKAEEATENARLASENAERADANARQADANAAAAQAAAERADANASAAQTAKERADANAEQARREKENVLRLSAFRELEQLQSEADALWPAEPAMVPRYDAWLARAEALLAGLQPSADGSDVGHQAQLEILRESALPPTDDEREAARRAHPRFAELQAQSADIAAAEQAVAEFRASLGDAPPGAEVQAQLEAVEAEIARQRGVRDELAAEIEAELTVPPRFARADDAWWYDQLGRLVASLQALADPDTGLIEGISEAHGWGIAKRREFAATIEQRTISGPEAGQRWAEAIASIADPAQCPLYDGLVLSPQLGLLPIGRDADSGLWEFWHVQSGSEPQRGADGKLVLAESMGVVLVLIPGGTFRMGAQGTDPAGQNYDPGAQGDEGPVHEVALSPYFLSKYELTQGQWERFTGRNPSQYRADTYSTSWNREGKGWSALHPVEQVSWDDCVLALDRLGLALPTEAQWENGCRAGTTTVWWSGGEQTSLQGVANLSDQYGKDHGISAWPIWDSWLDDGETVHARVGSYRPNAFGLHHMHGNVWEWSRDGYGDYDSGPQVDPLRDPSGARNRCSRGGSFDFAASYARSANRNNGTPERRDYNLGCRPAKGITP